MGRGPTAYFLFSDENRASAKAELAGQAGGKQGVAQVAKLIGQRWAALSDEEKGKYKERAAKLQEEAAAAAAAAAAAEGPGSPDGDAGQEEGGDPAAAAGGKGGGKAAAPLPPFGLPTTLVKRVVMMDGDVSRVSADGLRAICKAAELFMGQLAGRAMDHAVAGKRKNFKVADIEHLAGRDRRLQDMGLPEVLAELAQQAQQAQGGGGGENGADGGPASAAKPAKMTKKQKRDEAAAAGTRQITSFFGAAPAAAAAAEAEES